MTFFKNILRFLGWTVGILLLVCLLLVLAWWAQWSLTTVTFILCALAASVLLFWAGRKMYLWYNKRRYVRHVLTQDPSKQLQEEGGNPMERAWQEGFAKHSRFGRRSQTLPWAVFLEQNTKDTAQLLQVFRQNAQGHLLPQGTALQWYALPELLILRPHVKYTQQALLQAENQEEWEVFLVNMVKAHKKKGVNALILTVPTQLLQGDSASLQNYARGLRARVHEIESLSKQPVPIYILVTGIEVLEGLPALVAHMSEERRSRALGCDFQHQHAENSAVYVQKSLSFASLALRKELVQQAALQGIKPQGDMYLAPKSLEVLEGNLRIFMDCLFLGLPAHEQMLVRGLYYTYALAALPKASEEATASFAPAGQAFATATSEHSAASVAGAKTAFIPQGSDAPHMPAFAGDMSTLSTSQPASSPDFLAFGPGQGVDQVLNVPSVPNTPETPNVAWATPVSVSPAESLASSGAVQAAPVIATSSPLPPYVLSKRAEGLAFVEEVFLRIIPRDAHSYEGVQKPLYRERLVFPLLVAWFFGLFALCGIMAADVIHNNQSLQAIYSLKAPAADAPPYARMQWLQQRLHAFDQAQQNWWLPTLGLDRLQRERAQTVVEYKAAMEQTVVPAVVQDLLGRVSPQDEQAPAYEAARCLLWMQEALVQKMTHGNTEAIRAGIFPVAPPEQPKLPEQPGQPGQAQLSKGTVTASKISAVQPLAGYKPQVLTEKSASRSTGDAYVWSPTFGELFLSYLDVVDGKHLAPLQEQVSTALNAIFDGSGAQLFAYLEDSVNKKLSREAVGLSLYWPNVPAGTQGFTAVAPVFTKAGYESLFLQMSALLGDKNLTDQPYWKTYEQRYATAWSDFIVQSDAAWAQITQVSTLYSMGRVKSIFDDPYIRLIMKAAEALTPLQNSTVAPAWLEDMFLLRALLDVTRLSADTQPDSLFAIPETISSVMRSSDASIQSIKKHALKSRNVAALWDAIQDLRNYEAAVQDLRTTLTSEEGCFELAKVEFGGKAYGYPEDSRMAEANAMLRMALEHINVEFSSQRNSHTDVDWGSDSPAVYALRGPLRFLAHAISCTAALTLQKQWEADVLAPMAMVSPQAYLQTLVGEQGLLQAFVTEKAAPFLERTVGKYSAHLWMHVPFPFTQDFLHFIQEGQAMGMHLPKEAYVVSLISQTSDINDEAKERLQYFEISMPSSKGDLLLRNNNYPVRKNMTYMPAEPSPVRLVLSFPSVKLTREYASFIDFLNDFAYGEHVFTQEDFPESAEKLKSLGITDITVRVLPENASEILAAHDTSLPPIPERITKVW